MEPTCFFFGGYDLTGDEIAALPPIIGPAIDGLVDRGITRFLSAGLPAFDIICAEYILSRKDADKNLSLEFILPCRDMSPFYPAACMGDFQKLLVQADALSAVDICYQRGCLVEAVRRMNKSAAHVLYMDVNAAGR